MSMANGVTPPTPARGLTTTITAALTARRPAEPTPTMQPVPRAAIRAGEVTIPTPARRKRVTTARSTLLPAAPVAWRVAKPTTQRQEDMPTAPACRPQAPKDGRFLLTPGRSAILKRVRLPQGDRLLCPTQTPAQAKPLLLQRAPAQAEPQPGVRRLTPIQQRERRKLTARRRSIIITMPMSTVTCTRTPAMAGKSTTP